MMDRCEERAGVEKIENRSFHSFRRAFATGLSAEGIPVETISQLLGHRRVESDKPYLSYNRKQVAFCALGFDGIPVKSGLYKNTGKKVTQHDLP